MQNINANNQSLLDETFQARKLQRFKLTIEYDGTGLVGMQFQNNGTSVQSIIENAIFKFSGEKVTIHAAGRTDAGVHAIAQVIHFDLAKQASSYQIKNAINYYCKPHNVVVTDCEKVDADFHARFSAVSRSYIYKIINRNSPLALQKNKAWLVMKSLDITSMNTAAQILIGKHDLSSFRSSQCQAKSAIKSISEINVYSVDEELIEIYIKAPSFLHNQVRIIVGCLKKIGEGKWNIYDLQNILNARDRTKSGPTAPADGLYLYKIEYNYNKIINE